MYFRMLSNGCVRNKMMKININAHQYFKNQYKKNHVQKEIKHWIKNKFNLTSVGKAQI